MEKLNQLKYLELVMKESMRLFPVAPFVARELTEDVILGIDPLILESILMN
jgi:cytochrome P450